MVGRDERTGAAVGIRCHSGWAAFVVLGGKAAAPILLERGRLELCAVTIKGSKQPFHEAEQMELGAAEVFIRRCRNESEKLARRAVAALIERHSAIAGCCLLDASDRPSPDLKEVLASHARIHAAEGEFYRAVVARAAEDFGIGVERIRERDLEAAAEQLPGSPQTRLELLEGFGKQAGPPWRQDEKMAALSAWLALVVRPARRRKG